jgi:hypothetical protein
VTYDPQVQYLERHQTRDQEPGEYENLLGDALERAFGAGVTDLAGVVKGLVDYGVPAPDGKSWSEELLRTELKRLGT